MRFTVQRYDSVPVLPSDKKDVDVLQPNAHLPKADSLDVDVQLKAETQHEQQDSISVDSVSSGYVSSIARRGRMYAQRHRRRLVNKTGDCNIFCTNVSARKRKYIMDILTTMLDLKWRYNILVFLLAFLISWFLFAGIWWAICLAHGDHLHRDDDDWTMCMTNVYDFPSALLFSIETQHTIGYGFRSMETKCPEAFIFLMLQSALGVFMQSLVTGLIFTKVARPKKRARTVLFSHNAVICQRDGELVLLFRIGDMRTSHIVGTSIRAVLVQNRLTKEGEVIPLCQEPLLVEAETALPGDNYVFLGWPVTVVHRINKDSPFWEISAEQLLEEKFELVVILDGTIEHTGMSLQLRTSFLPTEILWGHHLAPLMTYQKEDGQYYVDFTQFHNTVPINMPECSASSMSASPNLNDRKETHPNTFTLTSSALTTALPAKTVKRRRKSSLAVTRTFWKKSGSGEKEKKNPLRRSLSEKVRPITRKAVNGHLVPNGPRLSPVSLPSGRSIPPSMEDIHEQVAGDQNSAMKQQAANNINILDQEKTENQEGSGARREA